MLIIQILDICLCRTSSLITKAERCKPRCCVASLGTNTQRFWFAHIKPSCTDPLFKFNQKKSLIATFCIFSPSSMMMMIVKSCKNRPVTSAQCFQDAILALNSLNTWAQLTPWFKTQPDSHIFVYFLSHFCRLHRVSFETKTCFIYLTKDVKMRAGCTESEFINGLEEMFDDFGRKKAENIQLAALVSKCCGQIKKIHHR